MRLLLSLSVLLAGFLGSSVQAADMGVMTGEVIPHNLSLQDHTGTVQEFDDYVGAKGAVVVFVRSTDWCPYCKAQLIDLRDSGSLIEELGYSIVTVSYDGPETLKAFHDKYKSMYLTLSDTGSDAIRAFGIENTKYKLDHFAYGIPHPHVYVVGKDKVVQAVLSEKSFKKRPQIVSIVEAIKDLN